MNIVYISHLTNEISQGPNYSVPAQVKAQSRWDNVFWWNLTNAKQDFWLEGGFFHNITEFHRKSLDTLPQPFNKPDLVVFESFYYIDDVKIAKECVKKGISYVIVPRSALTMQGQCQKKIKKKTANILFFKEMTKKASAIQYLTKQEYEDSGKRWNENYFIVPNGIVGQEKPEKKKEKEEIRGIFIGRFDPYQKGLDLLLEACLLNKDVLKNNRLTIELYGPERFGCRRDFISQVSNNGLDEILIVRDGVFGNEKYQVLREADFFIMTSRFEGMPMSMIEAMSFGLPCLATHGTNMTDQIDEYDAGWSCKCETEAIAEKLIEIIKNKNICSKLGINAWNLSKKYDWESIAKVTHEEYTKIVK